MNKYKTVKEVCDLTGLTRKHLYYFHHENVVRAVAYANYSVEGNDGYKLYDDAAVEKLQQIALCYRLGLKRDEIKKLMLSPGYDSNRMLQTLLAAEQEKKAQLERHIAALEYLILTGTKNGTGGALRSTNPDKLGQTLLAIRESTAEGGLSRTLTDDGGAAFEDALSPLLTALAQTEEASLQTEAGDKIIREIINLCRQHLGEDGVPFVLGLFMSVLGEGTAARELTSIAPIHGRAVLQYLINHPQLHGHTPHGSAGADEK